MLEKATLTYGDRRRLCGAVGGRRRWKVLPDREQETTLSRDGNVLYLNWVGGFTGVWVYGGFMQTN